MTRKTGTQWSTDDCGRCGQKHMRYSGKLDRHGTEYVVCEFTNKRMDVKGLGHHNSPQDFAAYPTEWTAMEEVPGSYWVVDLALDKAVSCPEIGTQWTHHNGNVYEVYDVTNLDSNRDKYPITISYKNVANGKKWSRKLSLWYASMTYKPSALEAELLADVARIEKAGEPVDPSYTSGSLKMMLEGEEETVVTRFRNFRADLMSPNEPPMLYFSKWAGYMHDYMTGADMTANMGGKAHRFVSFEYEEVPGSDKWGEYTMAGVFPMSTENGFLAPNAAGITSTTTTVEFHTDSGVARHDPFGGMKLRVSFRGFRDSLRKKWFFTFSVPDREA